MLTVAQLVTQAYNATSLNPRISDISLDLLREYYELILMPYKYQYTFSDKTSIELNFDEKRMCHLLGLETIVKDDLPKHKINHYKGSLGFSNIKNGLIDFTHLKQINKQNFNNMKNKILNFHRIAPLVESNAMAIEFKKVPGSAVECDIMIYDHYNANIIHLGIEKEDHGKSYFPRTFLIVPVKNGDPGDKFIKNQVPISIVKTAKIPTSTIVLPGTVLQQSSIST